MVGFIETTEYAFAGRHLLLDLYECQCALMTPDDIRLKLESICVDIGATVIYSYAHTFNNGGSSGAVILAESHCTWHHWTDEGFIALDIFVCGTCDPEKAIDSIQQYFKPTHIKTSIHHRGITTL